MAKLAYKIYVYSLVNKKGNRIYYYSVRSINSKKNAFGFPSNSVGNEKYKSRAGRNAAINKIYSQYKGLAAIVRGVNPNKKNGK